MDTHTDSELDTFRLLQTGIQVFYRSEDTQTRSYGSLRVIFMGVGIAKVDEESIPQELSNVTVIAANHLRTGGVIRPDHVPVRFGIELGREAGRIDQIAEHHGQLAT